MTEFITRGCRAEHRYEVIIKTDSEEHYCAAQAYARLLIDHQKPVSNADRIRAMSDEELAVWIASMTTVCECCEELNECESPRGFNRCSHGVEDWLKQPAEEET